MHCVRLMGAAAIFRPPALGGAPSCCRQAPALISLALLASTDTQVTKAASHVTHNAPHAGDQAPLSASHAPPYPFLAVKTLQFKAGAAFLEIPPPRWTSC